jgi:hypothetical protein
VPLIRLRPHLPHQQKDLMVLSGCALSMALYILSAAFWCDEVTHIARSVPFDYFSKNAQR